MQTKETGQSNFDKELYQRRLVFFQRKFAETGFDLEPENFLEYCARYSIKVIERGLYLFSNTGTGKTARMEFIRDRFSIKMVTALDFFESYKTDGVDECMNLANVRLKNRLNVYSDFYEDLIIDELGTEPPSANCWGTVCYPLSDVIEQRYIMFKRHGALTHFTSNKSLKQVKEIYGDRVFSRLNEMSIDVNMTGPDRRMIKTA